MSEDEQKAESRKRFSKATILIAVMATIAILGVIYGVLTHKEAGLLQVCWHNGHASYVEDLQEEGERAACKNPVPLIWPNEQIPLAVATLSADNAPLKEQERGAKIVRDAIDDLNLQIGKILFDVAKIQDDEPDVVVIWGSPLIVGANGSDSYKIGGSVSHAKLGSTMQAIVRIREISSDRLAFITAVHELAHSAGLAHDTFISSLMYPRMITAELNTVTTRLTDNDVRLLRTTYGL